MLYIFLSWLWYFAFFCTIYIHFKITIHCSKFIQNNPWSLRILYTYKLLCIPYSWPSFLCCFISYLNLQVKPQRGERLLAGVSLGALRRFTLEEPLLTDTTPHKPRRGDRMKIGTLSPLRGWFSDISPLAKLESFFFFFLGLPPFFPPCFPKFRRISRFESMSFLAQDSPLFRPMKSCTCFLWVPTREQCTLSSRAGTTI